MAEMNPITREQIKATEAVIRPFVRRTPLVIADMADFGLPAGPLTFKLELLQHSGSFKARGAFANLLLRKAPPAGVVASAISASSAVTVSRGLWLMPPLPQRTNSMPISVIPANCSASCPAPLAK